MFFGGVKINKHIVKTAVKMTFSGFETRSDSVRAARECRRPLRVPSLRVSRPRGTVAGAAGAGDRAGGGASRRLRRGFRGGFLGCRFSIALLLFIKVATLNDLP